MTNGLIRRTFITMKQSILRRQLPYARLNVTLWLIILNIFVFFVNTLMPSSRYYLSLIPSMILGRGYIWQFVTYMFCHANISHILFNMLGLFFFGYQLEEQLGSYEFLLYYLLTGVLAGVLSFGIYVASGYYNVVLLGASGAIFAVLLAFATYFPDARIFIMGIIPIRAAVLVLLYTGIEIFSQLFGSRSGVAHLTHLAGFGFGYLYFLIRLGINPIHRILPPKRGPWG